MEQGSRSGDVVSSGGGATGKPGHLLQVRVAADVRGRRASVVIRLARGLAQLLGGNRAGELVARLSKPARGSLEIIKPQARAVRLC